MDILNLARYFADFLYKYGAKNTDILEVKNGNVFSYMVVCTADNKNFALSMLIDFLDYVKQEFGMVNLGMEGYKKADWIIVDFDKIFVHIFQPKTREKFNIERLWKN
ncbi:MAG: ribosome silencing factor [Clostridia bacterium]|nr:ribosome silencing factor [Clostridia bacterium]